MNASQETKVAYFSYIGSIEVPAWTIEHFPQSGNCDSFIKEFIEIPEIKEELSEIDPENLKTELKEYGAWTNEQLEDHQENLERILWITYCNIIEEDHGE